MQSSDSTMRNRTRRIFTTFFALSSIIPLLFMTYLINQFDQAAGTTARSGNIVSIMGDSFLYILLLPLLSFIWVRRWIHSLEDVTKDIQSKSCDLVEKKSEGPDLPSGETQMKEGNEVQVLINSFNAIFEVAEDESVERQRLKELLAKLIAIASDLTAELDFDRLFPLIIGRITDVMKAERTSLFIIDREHDEIWTKVSEGISQIRLPIGKGISGLVAQTGETINVADAWGLPYFDRTFDENHNFRTKSVLCMPVKSRDGRRIGVVQVINKKGKDQFDMEDEVFLKGLSSQVAIALENSLLVDELWLSFESFIRTLSAAVDAREPLTAGHSQRVTEYSLMIAAEMGLTRSEMDVLKYASLLHDIGKVGIPDSILLKHGPYTSEERTIMNSHSTLTKSILDHFRFPEALQVVPIIACHHHEKMNGQGYPDGLTSDQIPLGSKIMAVADVFDALTSKREYPKYAGNEIMGYDALPLDKVISILIGDAGRHFDENVVNAFMKCLPEALRKYRREHFPPEYVDETIRRLDANRKQ